MPPGKQREGELTSVVQQRAERSSLVCLDDRSNHCEDGHAKKKAQTYLTLERQLGVIDEYSREDGEK